MQRILQGCTIILAIFAAGCGSSKEVERSKATPVPLTELQRYESTFRPSDYDVDAKVFLADLRKEKAEKTKAPEKPVLDPSITVPGYRVQMFASSEIDSANARKSEAEAAFPSEWFYVVYDPPTYKLRAGNFLTRADAETYAQFVASNGFPDAWIVPERVFKNVGARNPIAQPEESPKR
jgi:hypothetical protein